MAIQYKQRYFSVDEFHQMAEAGIISENERVELVEGEILEMSPIGKRHAAYVDRVLSALIAPSMGKAITRVQGPIFISKRVELQPDIALLKWRADFYIEELPAPADVLLVVEVANTSLEYDRGRKLSLYARAGISHVWIVSIPDGSIEMYANPAHGAYGKYEKAQHGQTLPVPGIEGASLKVDDLLG